MTSQSEPKVSFSTLWLLNANMDRGPFNLRDRGRDLENFSVRDVAIGLENDFAAILPDSISHGLAGLLKGDRGPFAMPQYQLRFGAWDRGFEQGQKRGRRLWNPCSVSGGRHVELSRRRSSARKRA